jgi:hypothetical protein
MGRGAGKGHGAAAKAASAKDVLYENSANVDCYAVDPKMEDPIDRLNAHAKLIAAKHPDDEALEALRRPIKSYYDTPEFCVGLGLANPTVYIRRWIWYTCLLVLSCVAFILNFALSEQNGWFKVLKILPFVWFYTDLFGGVLHIVLDTPSNVKYPVIGLPSLEFQLHHAIPQDIVRKGIWQACGDLNTIASYGLIISAVTTGFDKLTLCVGGMALLAGYAGQGAHQAAHKLPKDNNGFVKFLQKAGLFVSPEIHRGHHQTHDKDFCILCGWSSPLLQLGLKVMPQFTAPGAWIAIFVTMVAVGPIYLSRFLRMVI